MYLPPCLLLLCLLSCTTAVPFPAPSPSPLPLLIWHGLGDRYDADGLQSTGKLAQKVHPGTFVYYIRTDDDGGSDRTNTFFGNLTTQIEDVCEALHNVNELARWDGMRVDALGFSQGGQFLRGLLERCDGLSIRSLVTFGSQHNGIAQFQECGTFDFLCKGATALIKGNAWTDYVQNKVVPAQYYRTVNETTGLASDEYLEHSNFLADVNNEREEKNKNYKERIASLEKFAMYVFEDDLTVIPKESGWFSEVNQTSGEVIPLKERKLYTEDWLGLKALDKKDGIVFRTAEGKHMQLTDKVLKEAFKEFFGPERKAEDSVIDIGETLDVQSGNEDELAIRPKFRCGAMEAQAWWDSKPFYEKWRWHWNAVTKPWLKGDLVPLSRVGKAEMHNQEAIGKGWHEAL